MALYQDFEAWYAGGQDCSVKFDYRPVERICCCPWWEVSLGGRCRGEGGYMLGREIRVARGGRGDGPRLLHKLCVIVRTRMLRLGNSGLQCSEREHYAQPEFLTFRKPDPPKHWHWEGEYQYIGKDIQSCVYRMENPCLDAAALDRLVPQIRHRGALKCGHRKA